MNLHESIRNDLNKINLVEADDNALKNFKAPYEVSAEVAKKLILSGNDTVQWVVGDLDLSGSQINRLPPNLGVGGSLSIANTNVKELPNDLHVRGNLNISNTPITVIGPNNENVDIAGSLIANSTGLTSIGGEVYIQGDLEIENNKGLRSLPRDMSVPGDVYMKGTPIQDLANKEWISGEIYRD